MMRATAVGTIRARVLDRAEVEVIATEGDQVYRRRFAGETVLECRKDGHVILAALDGPGQPRGEHFDVRFLSVDGAAFGQGVYSGEGNFGHDLALREVFGDDEDACQGRIRGDLLDLESPIAPVTHTPATRPVHSHERRRITAALTHLGKPDGRPLIYVFGSNERGAHGKGSARYAQRFHGAEEGVGEGLCDHSYALPTKDADIRRLPLDVIRQCAERFMAFAREHHDMDFVLSRVGCGLAGYTDDQIAPLFAHAPDNIYLPGRWMAVLGYDDYPLVVSGRRSLEDGAAITARLERARDKLARQGRCLVVVEGGCRRQNQDGQQIGADYFAYTWARKNGLATITVDAQWERLGRAAGPARNELLGQLGAGLIAFPLGESRGTRGMIRIAQREAMPFQVVEHEA